MLHDILYFAFVFVVHNDGHFCKKKKKKKGPCASSSYPKPYLYLLLSKSFSCETSVTPSSLLMFFWNY